MDKIIKAFKHIFIPHEHNDYKPHIFRELSVGVIVVILIILFSVSTSTKIYINRSDMTSAVLPAVLIDLTNNARESNGVSLLARNSTLDKAAQMKANDMATLSYFAHTSPSGLTPWHWFAKANYVFSYAGENLAIDFSESVDVKNAWLDSPTHKANILNSKFTEIGIATAEGYYNGHPTTYVVQMFGKPIFPSNVVKNTDNKNEVKDVSIPKDVTPIKENENVEKIAISPVVKGEDINIFPEIGDLEIVKEDSEFISVKNKSVVEEGVRQAPTIKENYSRWYERFIFFTPSFINIIFKIIVYIIVLSLILMIIVEIKKQHLKSIIYGVLLLIILLCLIYLNKSFFSFNFLF